MRRLYDPMYRYWFRVEWEGLEKIPLHGGALLIANHGGAIPSDAPAIMHGIEEELGRPVYGLADYFFRTVPVVGTMWSRTGGVPAHPDNAYRLLHDQQQLALVFPEGTKATSKTYTDRYRLRRFGRGGFVEIAMRAGVPIIPIAVVGAEESMPILFRLGGRGQGAQSAVLSGDRQRPAAGTARLRDLLSGQVQAAGARPGDLRRGAGPGALLEEPGHGRGGGHPGHACRTPSTTCCASGAASGSAEAVGRRVLITGLDTFWGGRMAQALEAEPGVEMILGLGANEPRVPLDRTEFVRSDQKYSILSRIVRATQVDTIVHTFLETNSVDVSTRVLHEINVIGTLNLLAAASSAGSSVRQVVVKSSTHVYGAAETDPAWFSEETPRTSPVRTRVERSLLEVESLVRDFSEDNPHQVVSVLRFANVLGTDIVTPISYDLRKRLLPCIAGFDPLVQFIEEDDVVRALEYVTDHQIPGVFNVAGAGKLPWSEVASIGGAFLLPLPPVRPAALRGTAEPAGRRAVPARDGRPGPLRPGRGHLEADGQGLRVPLHQRRRRGELRPGQQPPPGHRFR